MNHKIFFSVLLAVVFLATSICGCAASTGSTAQLSASSASTELPATSSTTSSPTEPANTEELITVYCLSQILIRNGEGRTIAHTFTYDDDGNLLTRSRVEGDGKPHEVEVYQYDQEKRLIVIPHSPNGTGNSVTRTYDDQGRLLTESWRSNGRNFEEAYTYDSAGNLIELERKIEGELSLRVISTYDAEGRILTVTNDYASETLKDEFSCYEYDDRGNLLSCIIYNDVFERSYTYSYDENGHLSTYRWVQNGNVIREDTYFYNEKGNLIRTEQNACGMYAFETLDFTLYLTVVTYQYDENGNMVEKSIDSDEGTGSTTRWTYDNHGNVLSQEVVGIERQEWTYDEWGNVLTYRLYLKDELCYDVTYSYTTFQVTCAQMKIILQLQDDYMGGVNSLLK